MIGDIINLDKLSQEHQGYILQVRQDLIDLLSDSDFRNGAIIDQLLYSYVMGINKPMAFSDYVFYYHKPSDPDFKIRTQGLSNIYGNINSEYIECQLLIDHRIASYLPDRNVKISFILTKLYVIRDIKIEKILA